MTSASWHRIPCEMGNGGASLLLKGFGAWSIGGQIMLLGIEDPWIILGYAVMIISAIACVVYGWLKRNTQEE